MDNQDIFLDNVTVCSYISYIYWLPERTILQTVVLTKANKIGINMGKNQIWHRFLIITIRFIGYHKREND